MKKLMFKLAALLVILLWPLVVMGEDSQEFLTTKRGAFLFSTFAGGYIFQDSQRFPGQDANSDLENTYSLGLRLGYMFSRHFDIETTFNYVPTENNLGNVNAYLYHLDGVFNILRHGRFVPYIDAGFGGITFSPALGDSSTDPVLTYSGGLKIFIIENLAFRVDIRGYTKFHDTYTNLNINGGLTYWAGGLRTRDSDRDGYIDKFDLCPLEPENYNGYIDEDGCPEKTKVASPLDKYCDNSK